MATALFLCRQNTGSSQTDGRYVITASNAGSPTAQARITTSALRG
jgi:hypothetical protein